ERRPEGAKTGVVALAAVDVADERAVRVAPPDATRAVDVHAPQVGADLVQDLVLAEADALVRERHRGRCLLAAARVVLVDEVDPRDDVGLAERGVYRLIGLRPALMAVG